MPITDFQKTSVIENTGINVLSFNRGFTAVAIAPTIAAIISFGDKLGAILQTIPVPVMGGILIIFGTVIVFGMNTLVESGEDLLQPRNVAIAGAILILGVGGASIEI